MVDYSKYLGEWVVECNKQVIGHNKDLTKLKALIKSCKGVPTITKVPKEEILIF